MKILSFFLDNGTNQFVFQAEGPSYRFQRDIIRLLEVGSHLWSGSHSRYVASLQKVQGPQNDRPSEEARVYSADFYR